MSPESLIHVVPFCKTGGIRGPTGAEPRAEASVQVNRTSAGALPGWTVAPADRHHAYHTEGARTR
ncbi:hypothetical protein HNR25_000433 [Streptomonospora salina]|uniref:Uncharacterized protein n=1 Tax=Streptomonospora salina TaxID=104205 RepID=A0A841E1V7_9ACTN|nr:hypothetical protein [Streptomonospora salina]